jgi:hypothetical protein
MTPRHVVIIGFIPALGTARANLKPLMRRREAEQGHPPR